MIITVCSTLVGQMTANGIPAGGYKFGHGPAWYRNAVADHKNFPFVFLDTPLKANLELLASGAIGRVYPAVLFFMGLSKPDWTPEQHDQNVIQPMRLASNNFISLAQASALIDSVKNAKETEFINMLDTNVSGVMLNIDIKPRSNNKVCYGT